MQKQNILDVFFTDGEIMALRIALVTVLFILAFSAGGLIVFHAEFYKQEHVE